MWIVKSNYHGENAQGNILGVFKTFRKGNAHFQHVLEDRKQRIVGWYGVQWHMKLCWEMDNEQRPPYAVPEIRCKAFYVGGDKESELVELLRWRLS